MSKNAETDAVPKKKGKGVLVGVVLAVMLGAGGFYAVFSGLILKPADAALVEDHGESQGIGDPAAHDELSGPTVPSNMSDVAFIPVEPVVVSLAGPGKNRHLRFRAELEVPTIHQEDVEHLMPRVIDVMNAYLRAVDPETLSAPGALILLRSQILRRIGLVIGVERVSDVLVMEFVVS